ncbi:FIM5, partial [Symbiodinium sp. KB8]
MMKDENENDSRESRTFRMWLNSLDLERVYVNDLYRDLSDGVVLLKALDRVEPGIVNWKRVNKDPKNKYKKIENCNTVISTGKAMEFKLTNVGGMDI